MCAFVLSKDCQLNTAEASPEGLDSLLQETKHQAHVTLGVGFGIYSTAVQHHNSF